MYHDCVAIYRNWLGLDQGPDAPYTVVRLELPGEAATVEIAPRARMQIPFGWRLGEAKELVPILVAGEHRRLAVLHHVLGAAYGGGRVLADDQPVEQHADRCQMLLVRYLPSPLVTWPRVFLFKA